jgi:predicted porin
MRNTDVRNICKYVSCVAVLGTGVMHCAAAENVTVYGVIDTFVTRIHAEGTEQVTRMDASGMNASRIGFKGSEDLGDGNSINFVLENGINSNDGTFADSNRLFNRQAWIGLRNRWGELRLGRQNTPQWAMSGNFDAFSAATQASGWNNMFGAPPRIDNAIGYFSPNVNGFKFQALLARGALAGAATLAETAANQNIHLAAEYEQGPVYFGVNYEEIKNESVQFTTRRTAAGGSYRFNSQWKAFVAADKESKSDGSQDTNLYSISALYNFNPEATLAVGYAATRDRLSGVGHGNASQASVLYRYALSKRTALYGGYAKLQQSDNRNSFALSGAAVVEPGSRVVSIPGGNISGVQLGVVHFF